MCMISFVAGVASADSPSPSDRLGAEALAEEGAKLMAAGDYERGCKKYEESAMLDESPTRLIVLATCHERRGKVASAWAAFGEAAELAEARSEPKRLAQARESQKRLEPQIGRLKVIVPQESLVEDLVITRDGTPMPYTLWNLPVAVDPGAHVIRVTAPGRQAWQVEIGMMPGPSTVLLRVPVLQTDGDVPRTERLLLDRRGPLTPQMVLSAPPSSSSDAPPPEDPSIGRTQRTVGLVLAGTGVVSLIAGTAFALAAKSTHDDLTDTCMGNVCSAAAVTLLDQERSQSARANVALGIGLAALAGGAVVYFSAPTSSSQQTGGGARVASPGPLRVGASIGPNAATVVAAAPF
jgi:hypothetical protein